MFLVGYLVVLGGSVNASGLELQDLGTNQIKINEDFNALIKAYNSSNGIIKTDSDTSCIISFFNSSGSKMIDSDMIYETGSFNYLFNANNVSYPGRYSSIVYCNTSTDMGGYITLPLEATPTGQDIESINGGFLWIGILLPLIFSLLLLIGAVTLGEEHHVMKIFMFLLSFIPLFVSMWLFSETLYNVYYSFQNLQDAMGDITFWFIWLFIVIIFYFIIYFIRWAIDIAAQNKKEKLEY